MVSTNKKTNTAKKKIGNNINCVIVSTDNVLFDPKTKSFIQNQQLVGLIRSFVKRNNKFIICGSHNLIDVEATYKHFEIYDFCPYSVACNGSLIFNNFRKQKISHRYLTKSIINAAEELQSEFNERKIPIALLGYDGYNCIKVSKNANLTKTAYREIVKNEGWIGKNCFIDVVSLKDELPLVKLVWKLSSKSKVSRDEIYNQIINGFSKLIIHPVVINDELNDHIEVNMIGNNKTNAITELIDLLKLQPENCMLIGNGENDAALFDCVGVSVVSQNSSTKNANINAKVVLRAPRDTLITKALSMLV